MRTHLITTAQEGWEKVVQSVQTEPKGYPKLYVGTARGEVCAEQNAQNPKFAYANFYNEN